jgi:hypothetical protein
MSRSMTPRVWLFLGLTLVAAAHLWLIQHQGWNTTWRRWHIDARTPHFSDLRAITGAADSLDRGFNPREKNPGAPFGQLFNQTRVWLWLRDLGFREADSTAIGAVMLVGYAVGLWWLCAWIDGVGALLLVPLILSPAALLAVERGTTDLSVFFLLALAAHLATRFMRTAVAAVLVAFVLKLFPLAGVVLVLREPRHRALRLGVVVLALAVLFCAFDFRELIDIGYKTEKGPHTSYGWAVLSLHLGTLGGTAAHMALLVRCLCGAAVAIGIGAVVWTARRASDDLPPSRALDFFRVGAAVYAGTFALGASWDYRLIFVLFMVPQLAAWTRDHSSALRPLARSLLAALFVAAWSLALKDWLDGTVVGNVAGRILEEFAKWSLFFGCAYLLVRTLPSWLKQWFTASPAQEKPSATR